VKRGNSYFIVYMTYDVTVCVFLFISDMVDWIVQNLINTSRSHRGVTKKLRELGYNVLTKVSEVHIAVSQT